MVADGVESDDSVGKEVLPDGDLVIPLTHMCTEEENVAQRAKLTTDIETATSPRRHSIAAR